MPLTEGDDVALCALPCSCRDALACWPLARLQPLSAAAAAAAAAPMPSRPPSGALGALGRPSATVCAVTPEPSAGLLARSRPELRLSSAGANAELAKGDAAIADVEAVRRDSASSAPAVEKADGAVPGRLCAAGAYTTHDPLSTTSL